MRIKLHRHIPDDPELRRAWNSLASQSKYPQVFYTYEWALAMQAAYQASLKPLLFTACGECDDEIIAIAALATDQNEKTITFLSGNTADYCDFLSAPAHRAQFVNEIFRELSRLQPEHVILANLPADSATVTAIEGAAENHGFHLFLRPAYRCAQVRLGAGERRQELKSATSRKKMFLRKMRALEKKGTVKAVHLESWDSIAPALPTYAQAHAAHFCSMGKVSSLSSPERRDFIENLAKQFSESGAVTLSILTVNDESIAWNYGFRFHGSWFWYQPAFATGWEEYSPGYCLLARIIIDACDMEEINLVDLGLGEEGYKDRFANASRQTLHATLSASWKQHAREVMRYRAATLLKKTPVLESAVRSALGK